MVQHLVAEGSRTTFQNRCEGHHLRHTAHSVCAKNYASVIAPDLKAVIDAWSHLPAAIRSAIKDESPVPRVAGATRVAGAMYLVEED